MRLPSGLTIGLVICLIAIALPAAPVQADGASIRLSPSSGVPGEKVKVYGNNFTAREWVDIYYYLNSAEWTRDEVQADGAGAFTFTLTIPESYKGDHKVRADEDSSSVYAEATFEVQPGLILSPQEGPVGTTATVGGVGFAKDEEGIELIYYVNGNYETVAESIEAGEDGSWERSFRIPSSAKGSHRMDAQSVTSTLRQVEDVLFEVTPGITLDKLSGSVDENITVTGSGFYANDRYITISFAGEERETEPEIVRADENGSWTASFKVPEMPTDEYSVGAEGEYTEDVTALTFKIQPSIVLSTGQGHVGTNLTVTGGGFAVSKNVVVKYDGSEVGTARTDAEGSFSGVTFPVPESRHGQRQVTAQDADGNNATKHFTMESDRPDPPELISPADGARVGLIGKARPTFDWTEVEDLSGVYYNLQIAASANATNAGFVEPVLSLEGLVAANYTLNATQALPHGTYYWIVQAVDRAENAGDWTAAGSFRVGLLPLWASIVILVAIVALIGILLYFFVIRKRIYYY